MQSKLVWPLVVLSAVGAIAFTVRWFGDQRQVHTLVIATGGQQGEYYAFAQALSQVVNQHEPKIRIQVKETAGSVENLQMIEDGQAQMAIVQSDTAPRPSVRAIAYLFPEVFHLMVRSESNIQSVTDLRGRRVALMPQGSGSNVLFDRLTDHYNLSPQEFTPLPMQPDEAYEALKLGQVDALFRVIAIGNQATSDVLRASRARLLPIDQAESLRLFYPFLEASVIPKGTYDGALPLPQTDIPVVGVRAVLVADADVDPEVARLITKTLFEFRSELVQIYPRAALMRLPDAGENLGLPLHPGARAYYDQDEPSFMERYSESMGLLLSIAALVASALWQSHSWLQKRQKNRADLYNLKILNLTELAQTAENLDKLEHIRQQLFEILRRVIEDLDCDRITPESFQGFTFTWEMAIATVRHREMILAGLSSNLRR